MYFHRWTDWMFTIVHDNFWLAVILLTLLGVAALAQIWSEYRKP